MRIVDTHAHYVGRHDDVEAMLAELDLKLLNVSVAHDVGDWQAKAEVMQSMLAERPHDYAWCTTFDPPGFDDPDYADRVIDGLRRDFAAGAIACKLWKIIGMRLKDPDGNYVQMDHPIFEPLYRFLAETGKPLLAHVAEPIGCWQPLGDDNPHTGYYSQHPEWHMHGKAGVPSHGEIIAARDRVMASHPDLRLVGAHMGSQEHDLAGIAERMDRFPSYAIDLSRVWDMTFLDPAAVRAFHVAYQDRLMFATDYGGVVADKTDEQRAGWLSWVRQGYLEQKAFYETAGEITIGPRACVGLGLPADVVEKIYWRNAARVFPGLDP